MKRPQPPARHSLHTTAVSKQVSPPRRRHRKKLLIVLVVIVVALGIWIYRAHKVQAPTANTASITTPAVTTKTTTPTIKPGAPQNPAPITACTSNTLSQVIIVSINQQHLWACNGTTESYDSAVVTGMELYPADLTPTGTYHIYAKETNQTLTGHDSTGSWSDPVSYWMPFLDNEYGEYGFHDATWRAPSDFGNININNPYTDAEHGSHGCVELPLATAKWIYGWAPIGTTVIIES